jgi:uncharacterized protein YjbJ (UPF0337 family)
MNWNKVEGQWVQYRRLVKRRWCELSEAELDEINGRRELLVCHLQKSYGVTRDTAELQIEGWCTTFGDDDEDQPAAARLIERNPFARPPPSFSDSRRRTYPRNSR